MQKVYFHSEDRIFRFEQKNKLKDFINNLFQLEKTQLRRLDYIFCSDEYLLQLNRSALNHDYYTDILTFPLHEEKQPVEAEIYISLDRVRENASLHREKFKTELLRVIFHGALHLCGFDDHLENDIREMRTKENQYISLFQENVSRETKPRS